jgi:hypothetical protein
MANSINFNPTRDWVVVPDPSVRETESGIMLSEGAAMAAKKPEEEETPADEGKETPEEEKKEKA